MSTPLNDLNSQMLKRLRKKLSPLGIDEWVLLTLDPERGQIKLAVSILCPVRWIHRKHIPVAIEVSRGAFSLEFTRILSNLPVCEWASLISGAVLKKPIY